MDPMLISIAAFLGVAALIGGAVFVMRDFGSTSTEDRLAVMTGQKAASGSEEAAPKEEIFRESLDGIAGAINKFISKFGNIGQLLEQADSPIKAEAFFGLSGGCALLGVAAAMVAHSPLPLYPVAAIMGGVFPLVWMSFRRKRRFKKFGMQLPDALELVGRALRSGHSLSAGLHMVVEEMPEPISMEFAMVHEEQNLGVPIEQALKSMLTRMPNLDLKFFVTAVVIQRQSGGDLAEILDKIGHIIRERFKILGQVQALTGEGRISGVVLMGLPVALFGAVYHINPDYVMLLFTEELGRQMLGVAVFLQILGAIVIQKIIQIKV